jgi:hypothetical protein
MSGIALNEWNRVVRSILRLLFAGVAVLGTAGCAIAQEHVATPQVRAQQAHPLQGAADWRERIQENHNADQSIEQQVRRLTRDLDLTPEQQEKVRQLSKEHRDHDQVNAILTPRQLELMQAMVGRLDTGKEDRHLP